MNKLKKILLAAVFALAVLAAFHQTKLARDARNEAQELREQQARSAKEISNLKDSLADANSQVADLLAENSLSKNNSDETELLKLRGEVTRLRPLQEDVVALQKMLQQNSAGLPSWKSNELANVGRANPIDALQTYLYSAQQTNAIEIQNSIISDDIDPVSAEELQKFIQTESNHPSANDRISGFKILSETWLAPDKVQVELSAAIGKGGAGISVPMTLRKVNGEWKLMVFNSRGADGKVNSVEFFKEPLNL
jgi:hypothetical protein